MAFRLNMPAPGAAGVDRIVPAANPLYRAHGLMNPGTVGNMLTTVGKKINMIVPVFINHYLPRPLTTDANVISSLAVLSSMGVENIPVDARIFTLIQACAVGYEDTDCMAPAEAKRIIIRGIKVSYPTAPDPVKEAVRVQEGANMVHPPWTVNDDVIPTDEQLTQYVVAISEQPTQKNITIKLFAQALLAYCKQGNVSNNVVTKVGNAIRDELLITVDLDIATIRTFWNMCGPWFTHEKAGPFFAAWENAIGGSNLRFRLLCQQASWSGMTNYVNIHDAKGAFPDFPWGEAVSYFPDDFARFDEACMVVGGNEFYGYRRDLGVAKSTNYPNLSYLAYALLVEIKGDRSLRDFQGTNRNTPHAAAIDRMVGTYRTARLARQAEPTPEHRMAGERFLASGR